MPVPRSWPRAAQIDSSEAALEVKRLLHAAQGLLGDGGGVAQSLFDVSRNTTAGAGGELAFAPIRGLRKAA